jgi:CHAD domain-containing protein/CYTH domain-containing protein
MRSCADAIDRPAEEGARMVALELLGDADEAVKRLDAGGDDEALHDFRVAVRRLRSVLRALRPWLEESVRPRAERRLKKCARATNAARDAEVQLAWLESRREALATPRLSRGVELLETAIAQQREVDTAAIADRFRRASGKLRRRLRRYVQDVERGNAERSISFGGVLATLVGHQLDVVRERLDAVTGAMDVRGIHVARIEAKRLRYLVEPLRDDRRFGAREVVKQLKGLQDVLGELHDVHVLGEEIADVLALAAADRARRMHALAFGAPPGNGSPVVRAPNPRPGLLAAARIAAERRDALYVELEHEWRHGALAVLTADVRALEHALESRAGGKLERERKYLLSAVPPRALEAEEVQIDQGWLPGARLRERIRRVRSRDGERFWRGLKQGAGRARLEAEEETTREVFDALWPLTEGRRIAKQRRKVADGGLVWEIDEFAGGKLVMAEVELLTGGAVTLPDWLRPLVQREVTDDPAYLNENLATQPPSDQPVEGTSASQPAEGGSASGEDTGPPEAPSAEEPDGSAVHP